MLFKKNLGIYKLICVMRALWELFSVTEMTKLPKLNDH